MTWYPGENWSGRTEYWKPGDIVRIDNPYGGRLFRIEALRPMTGRGPATAMRYYGREWGGEYTGRYHGQVCGDATPEQVEAFKKYRDKMDVERNLYAGHTFDEWYAMDPRPAVRD